MVSYVPQLVRIEEQMVRICLYICACVCGSTHDCGLGVWSMAVMLMVASDFTSIIISAYLPFFPVKPRG